MKKRALKLLLSSTAASLAALSLTASTFAYVLISNNVLVQDFSFEIEGQEGLNISLDGENWSQDITTAQIKAKIEEAINKSFDTVVLEGVTPKQKLENYKYVIDSKIFEKDSILLEYDEREYIYQETTSYYVRNNNGTYVKEGDSYREATAAEIADATISKYSLRTDLYYNVAIDAYELANETIIKDSATPKYEMLMNPELGKVNYSHQMVEATENQDYIAFDLYFKAISTGGVPLSNYKLVFGENTKMALAPNANKTKVLDNAFTAGTTNYVAGDTLTVDASNAMRLGVSKYDLVNQNNQITFDESDNFSIFEVSNNLDLGSAAIKGKTDAAHKPEDSIMLNYYNALHPLYPYAGDNYGANDGEAYDTIRKYGDYDQQNEWVGETIGNFTDDGIMKVKFYIWLEGWDSDYLGNIEAATKINANFEFVLVRN